MATVEINTQMLSSEIDNLNRCVSDWIVLAAEQLPEDSTLHSLGVLLMQHHDVFTTCLQQYLVQGKAPFKVAFHAPTPV